MEEELERASCKLRFPRMLLLGRKKCPNDVNQCLRVEKATAGTYLR